MMKKRFATAVTIALAAASIFGCSNSASQSKQTTQAAAAAEENTTEAAGNTIGSSRRKSFVRCRCFFRTREERPLALHTGLNLISLKTVADSITSAAEADGNKTVVVDAQQDSTKQIQIIEDFIAQDVDAVFLNPLTGMPLHRLSRS